MAQMKRPRLKKVEVLPNFKLRLTFIDGSIYTVSFEPIFNESPGLSRLKKTENFADATIIEGEGWAVVWPELDIQIGADTLLLDARAQNAPDENTRVFAQWRAKNSLSLKEAAVALGLTPRTISAYSTSSRPVPKYIALACKGWEAERSCHHS